MIEAFLEAQEYINGIPKFVRKNTMQDTKDFYQRLGSPGIKSKVIHVAGTNGKGSVCAYLQSVLMEAGYRAGMFTSPHLVSIRERIRVDHELISEEDFAEAFAKVHAQIKEGSKAPSFDEKMADEKLCAGYHPSYFEFLYFMAMLYFEKKRPDFIILETGLGGRLDATNSFPTPCISMITEIGFDHMEYLGESLEEIAREKAGIVKKGVPLVYLAKNKSVSCEIEKCAKKADSRAFSVNPAQIVLKNCDEKGIDFSDYSGYYKDNTFHLATKALYQQENAALCMKALAVLGEWGVATVLEEHLLQGLAKAHWEGRMEEVLPEIYVDGAHNVDGIAAFLESVCVDGAKKKVLLYSSLVEKACGKMAQKITMSGLFEEIVITEIENSRAAKAEELAKLFREQKVTVLEEVKEAFAYCLRLRDAGRRVYITGSLYLIGQVKALAEGRKEHD